MWGHIKVPNSEKNPTVHKIYALSSVHKKVFSDTCWNGVINTPRSIYMFCMLVLDQHPTG